MEGKTWSVECGMLLFLTCIKAQTRAWHFDSLGKIMKLQNWSVRSRPWGQFESPEQEGSCLYGLIVGHSLHRDGREVLTSRLAGRRANCVVTSSGSEYELGEIDPAYERTYPEARQRLLASLEPLERKAEVPAAAAA